jgi:hypothetical protein
VWVEFQDFAGPECGTGVLQSWVASAAAFTSVAEVRPVMLRACAQFAQSAGGFVTEEREATVGLDDINKPGPTR